MLTQEFLHSYLHYDPITGVFTRLSSGRGKRISRNELGSSGIKPNGENSYILIYIYPKQYLAHRLAWLYMYDYPIPDIDHIDGNPRNNAINNLRAATQSQNAYNKRIQSNNTTGHKGVAKYKNNRYQAYIDYENKRIAIGTYDTIEEAIEARRKFAIKLHGEYFRLS